MTIMKLVTAALLLGTAASASAQASYEGAGETSELDCDGGTATITGASNTMTVTGGCKQLIIEGAGNRVQVDLAPKGIIRITGAGNRVTWRTPDATKAQVQIVGAGNRVTHAR